MNLFLGIKRSTLKTLMLPFAMIAGVVFYKWMGYITFLSPYLIFLMLFITYCKLKIKDFKPDKFEISLLIVQLILSGIFFFSTVFWNKTLAEGLFICVFIPTATAAPVITSMLGGSISKVATYSLLYNGLVAIIGPFLLALISEHSEISFYDSFLLIISEVAPLLILPLFCALMIRKFLPKLHKAIESHQQISFYLWAVSLFIVVGSSVSFAVKNWEPSSTDTVILLAIGALIACLVQFKIGRLIGARFNSKVSGGQALGQKNTVLAVWMALTYLNPLASLAPASYVAWQNIVNSIQLMRKKDSVQPANASGNS